MQSVLVFVGLCSLVSAQFPGEADIPKDVPKDIPGQAANNIPKDLPPPPDFAKLEDLKGGNFGQLCDAKPEICFSCVDDPAKCKDLMPLCEGELAAKCQEGFENYEDCKFDNPDEAAKCAEQELTPPADEVKTLCETKPDTCAALIKKLPPKAKPAKAAAAAGCFHASGLIQTETGFLTMADLASSSTKNIKVLSWDRNTEQAVFSPVRGWVDVKPNTVADFVEFRTQKGTQLSLTKKHLIYRAPGCQLENMETVFAEKIQEGDCVRNGNEGGRMERVDKVEIVSKTGVFSPITEEGSIIVDGIVASCFSYNEDEEVQRFIYGFVFGAKEILSPFLPSNILAVLFGSDGGYSLSPPVLALAFENFQKFFV